MTPGQWRKLALSFPETEEKSHFEQADFRVKNKIFAGLSKDEKEGNLKLSPEIQATVLDDETFYPASGAWGRSGWTRVVLANADLAVLKPLMAESWRLIAPKTLVAESEKKTGSRKRETGNRK